MFDIGFPELMVVALLALIVVGPKDLPRALKTIMGMVRKAKGMAREFQSGVDEMVREADLDDLKKEAQSLKNMDFAKEIENNVDPTGEISKNIGENLSMDGVRAELESIKVVAADDAAQPEILNAKPEPEPQVKSLADLEADAERDPVPTPAPEPEMVAMTPSELSEEMLTSPKKS